jgi:hypothetical protein
VSNPNDLSPWIVAGMGVLSILGTINGFLLTWILKRIGSMEEKLGETQTKIDCEKSRMDCRHGREKLEGDQCREVDDVWTAFNRHSHEGLLPGSKVTR